MIRPAVAADLPAIERVLVRAFADDPPMRWILRPDGGLETFFRLSVRTLTFPHGGVFVDDALRAAALWTPPGKWRLRWYEQLRDLPAWGRAIGWSRLAFIQRATAELVACHPHTPHHYLLAVGVDPAHQGHGLATKLLAPTLARCDAEQVPAYLEASRPALVPFYERLGFTPIREVRLGTDGPTLVPMQRIFRPRADPARDPLHPG